MRTRMFPVAIVGLLLPLAFLLFTGCRSSCGHCQTDNGTPSNPPTSAASGTAPSETYGAGDRAAASLPAADRYQGQRTCPVSGAALAGVAAPMAVAINGQTVYVCCARCAAKLRSDPETYLAKVAAERAGTSAPAPSSAPSGTASGLYGGQKTCPVTGEELDSAGGAIPVNVRGQTIYVCCSGCAAKVRRNPDLYLGKAIAERTEKGPSRP